MEERLKNQTWILDSFYLTTPIAVIGVWGIWSTTVMALAMMWFQNVTLIDDDTIEIHNTASQWYWLHQIGKTKVEAMAEQVKLYYWLDYIANVSRDIWDQNAEVILSCVDDMDVRKRIVDWSKDNQLIIEWRMSWQLYEVRHLRSNFWNKKLYEINDWFPQSEAEPIPCTEKSISYNTLAVWSCMANVLKKLLSKQECPSTIGWDLVNFQYITNVDNSDFE